MVEAQTTGEANGLTEDMAPTPGGRPVSKVVKFGWTVVDQPGEFRQIPKRLLRVDPDYQRHHVRQKRVLYIAAEWSWLACGALLVAERDDGGLWVFDGQHRKLAADKRSDIDLLPCLVFRCADKEDEARGFLRVNTARAAPSALDRFPALILAGDPDAVAVKRMVEDSGYVIGEGTNQSVTCAATLMRELASDPVVLRTVWGLMVQVVANEKPRNNHFSERHVGALCYLEKWLQRHERGSVADATIANALVKAGMDGMYKEMSGAAAFYKKGGPRVWAAGLVRLLNVHRRGTRKLPDIVVEG